MRDLAEIECVLEVIKSYRGAAKLSEREGSISEGEGGISQPLRSKDGCRIAGSVHRLGYTKLGSTTTETD